MHERVLKIISVFMELRPEEIRPDTDLYRYCDDLDVIEMVVALEEETGISIPDEALGKLYTVGDVLSYVEKE